ncbi:hypothetical protein HRG84_08135 [Flavisolibacter sp. BT320]|nr:hypothetical protein [Flavisolibacter longurius]
MRKLLLSFSTLCFIACENKVTEPRFVFSAPDPPPLKKIKITDKESWPYFLQHLPEKEGTVVDYKGQAVADQEKMFSLINYDVGKRDLQQCADALMRLRAEYLFARQRYNEIRFHFTNGTLYTFKAYVSGQRPVASGSRVRFITTQPASYTYAHLRSYLELVYAYAGTISLASELKSVDAFTIGTVILTPGSPGHCMIITDMATTATGDTLYKLVEGYTPAQSIYVLRNTHDPDLGYWHRLGKGVVQTASYTFRSYQLKAFE